MKKIAIVGLGLACTLPAFAQQTDKPRITVLAAGSLREVMTERGLAQGIRRRHRRIVWAVRQAAREH